jgi:hypothetical protein
VEEAMRISFLENLPDESTPTQFFRGVWKAHFPLAWVGTGWSFGELQDTCRIPLLVAPLRDRASSWSKVCFPYSSELTQNQFLKAS